MARFILQPCHIREDRFAPVKDATPLDLDWTALRTKLAPSGDRMALMNLRRLEMGAFIGLTKYGDDKVPHNFVLLNQDRSARIDWVLKKDPTFEDRLLEVYRVDGIKWDAVTEEVEGIQKGK